MKTARGTDFNLDSLMQKLTDEPEKHRSGAARLQIREGNKVDADDLMSKLSQRAPDIAAEHEAQRKKKEAAEQQRRRLHPNEYEKLMHEKGEEGY